MLAQDTTVCPDQAAIRFGPSSLFGHAAFAVVVLGIGVVLLLWTVRVGLLNTVLVYVLVTLIGLRLCRVTQLKLADPRLYRLRYFWLIKLGVTLGLLYVGWIPELDPGSSASWGYDPQRYFWAANDLVEAGWNPTVSLNYQGIVFYYGALFYLFGHNPVLPALMNAFVTLLGTLYLIRVAYELKGERGPRDWTFAYVLLVPEVLWYDVMTSRETLAGVLVLVSSLAFARWVARSDGVSFVSTSSLFALGLVALAAVRASVVIGVMAYVAVMLFFLSTKKLATGIRLTVPFVVVGVLVLAVTASIQEFLGGYEFDYLKVLGRLVEPEESLSSEWEWSDKSVGLLLVPESIWQAVLFAPLRAVMYLVAPLPGVTISAEALAAGNWRAWQYLLSSLTSLLNLLALPYAMAGFELAYRQRRLRVGPLAVHVAFWIMLMTIAGANVIIHERYRVMVTLLLFASAWYGYASCTKAQVRRFGFAWFGFLGLSAISYMVYKVI